VAQAANHWRFTVEVRAGSQVGSCEICGGQSGTGTGFCASTSVYHVSIFPPMLHTHLHLHVALTRRTNGPSLGTCQKPVVFRKSGSFT
jgi:hypothetical protein